MIRGWNMLSCCTWLRRGDADTRPCWVRGVFMYFGFYFQGEKEVYDIVIVSWWHHQASSRAKHGQTRSTSCRPGDGRCAACTCVQGVGAGAAHAPGRARDPEGTGAAGAEAHGGGAWSDLGQTGRAQAVSIVARRAAARGVVDRLRHTGARAAHTPATMCWWQRRWPAARVCGAADRPRRSQ
jgi:hypothetical protein